MLKSKPSDSSVTLNETSTWRLRDVALEVSVVHGSDHVTMGEFRLHSSSVEQLYKILKDAAELARKKKMSKSFDALIESVT